MPTPSPSDGTPFRRRLRATWPGMTTCLLLAAALAACTASESIRDTTAPVQLVAANVSQTSDPFGDVMSSSGIIPPDTVDVEFIARLKDGTDTSEPSFQDIVLQRYEVTFRRIDGGTAVPSGFQRGMNALVQITPNGQSTLNTTTVDLVLVPATVKSQPPVSHLIDPGFEPDTGFVNIQVMAEVRFFGETVAGDPVSTTIEVGIDFADFGDSN